MFVNFQRRDTVGVRHVMRKSTLSRRRSCRITFLFASRCKRADGGTAFPTGPLGEISVGPDISINSERQRRDCTTDVNWASSNCFYILGCVSSRLEATRPPARDAFSARARPVTGITSISEMNAKRYSRRRATAAAVFRDSPTQYF